MSELERRIAAALTSADITAADLAALVAETEAAIVQADADIVISRETGLDLSRSPDAAAARANLEGHVFAAARLRTIQPKLQMLHQKASAGEAHARWSDECDQVEAQRDRLAARFAKTYPAVVADLTALLTEMALCDRQCDQMNSTAPNGERHVLGPELVARQLMNFSREMPSIAARLLLPDWERSEKSAWPPPKVPLAALVAASMVPGCDPLYTDHWHEALSDANSRRAEITAERIEQEALSQAEARRRYEDSLRH